MSGNRSIQVAKAEMEISNQGQWAQVQPGDVAAQLNPFESCLFAGDLDSARQHIRFVHCEKPQAVGTERRYSKAIEAEATRRKVLAGHSRPKFLVDVPIQAKKRLDALVRYATGAVSVANNMLDRTNVDSPSVMGILNGDTIDGLRDIDDLFGPNLEVFVGWDYCWVPLDQIESLSMKAVTNPLDTIWRPANLAVRHGPQGDVLIPGLYPGSHSSTDEAVRQGRTTTWSASRSGPLRGMGGRVFIVGKKLIPFVDWRTFVGRPQSRF